MTNCKKCWWYGKPIECPANFNIDTKECKNFKPKQNHPTEKGGDSVENVENGIYHYEQGNNPYDVGTLKVEQLKTENELLKMDGDA